MNVLEITQMMTLSTGHLTEATREELQKTADGYSVIPNITVYNKDDYGWFLYIDLDEQQNYEGVPDDLRDAVKYALENDCRMICFDVDGRESNDIPVYESAE